MLLNHSIAGEGETLVLMHGLFGSLENLGVVARQLQKHFRVISLDLPDHGRSPHSESFSYQGYGDSVIATLDQLGVTQFSLLGHSMGGKVAMHIALRYPQRVNKLLVADIAPVTYPPRHDAVFKALQAVNLKQLTSRKEADQQMAEFLTEMGVRQFLLKGLDKDDSGFRWRFNLPMLIRDYLAISEGIVSDQQYTSPSLFVIGGNSNYVTQAHQKEILALFPNATAKIINDAGHWLHAEKPFVFAGIAERFFSE